MRRLWWIALILVVPAVVSCRRVKRTTYYGTEEAAPAAIPPAHYMGVESCDKCHEWNLVASHDSTSPQYKSDCVKCHGDRTEDITLSGEVQAIHPKMCPYVYEAAGETSMTSAVCRYCHENVQRMQDFRGASGGALRKQVNAELTCVECHTSDGPGPEFYQK